MKEIIKKILLIGLLCLTALGAGYSKEKLRAFERSNHVFFLDLPPLYLPQLRYVKLITLGFNNLASDLLWFNTLNYFGKRFQAGRDYKWLSNNCDLVTSLNPSALDAIEFCAMLLSWSAKEPEKSNEILTSAIKNHPLAWRYRYLRGFNYWYFLEDRTAAGEDLLAASTLPDAPVFLASLASRLLASDQDPEIAVLFLENVIRNTKDNSAKAALTEKLKLAYVSVDIKRLTKLLLIYQDKFGQKANSLQSLKDSGLISTIPKDPFGDPYFLDESGIIKSTSGKTGLIFGGKTAKTGIFSQENK